MSLYCVAINWGEGFITHGDREKGVIQGFPGDVWVADDNMRQWMAKVNATTKTTRAEEIFNKFRDKNEVFVQGDVDIDGDNYVILRKIIRKKTKKGDWSVKTSLDFFKKLKDGSLQNFTGEQRRETEKFIKEAIGNVDDFLLTILTFVIILIQVRTQDQHHFIMIMTVHNVI